MPRTNASNKNEIPWGECSTDEGTALMNAIKNLDLQAVKTAISAFSDPSQINQVLLYNTHTRSKEEEDAHAEALPPLCVLAVTEGTKNKENGDSAAAVSNSVLDISQALLEAGADPAVRGNYLSAPYMSVEVGAIETCRAMLQHLKQQGKTVTCGSSWIGKTRQNGTYGGHGADIFYAATRSENPEILPLVFEILKDELGPDTENDYKMALGRLLEIACSFRSLANVTFLLEKGASPEGVHFDKKEDWCDWQRPLHSAANQGDPEIVQALLDAGASTQTRCVNGLPIPGGPIHFACRGSVAAGRSGNGTEDEKVNATERRLETVRRLIQAGCDVNQPSVMERKTPLELAIFSGACDMIRFLIVEVLCDTNGKNYERMARQHKKKAVARAYERSIRERDENGGQSRPVKLRRVSAENESEPEMIEFPLGGDAWTWDGEEDMFPTTVQLHPQLGLHNGEEQLQRIKEIHGRHLTKTSESMEEDEDQDEPDSQRAVQLANSLSMALKGEALKSETESQWNPFWILSASTADGDEKPAAAAHRPSRRSRRRGGPSVEDAVKQVLQQLFGREHYDTISDKITVQVMDISDVGEALELGKRSPSLKAFATALRGSGVDKAVAVILNGEVVFPLFVGCIVMTLSQPSLVGVYATKVET